MGKSEEYPNALFEQEGLLLVNGVGIGKGLDAGGSTAISVGVK